MQARTRKRNHIVKRFMSFFSPLHFQNRSSKTCKPPRARDWLQSSFQLALPRENRVHRVTTGQNSHLPWMTDRFSTRPELSRHQRSIRPSRTTARVGPSLLKIPRRPASSGSPGPTPSRSAPAYCGDRSLPGASSLGAHPRAPTQRKAGIRCETHRRIRASSPC